MNVLYAILAKIPGKVWRQIDEQEASTGAAAVRKTRTSQRQRGNEYPTGTRYKALALRRNK